MFIIRLLFQVMNLIGDVKGKVAVMLDDMIDTAGESQSLDVFLFYLLDTSL